MANKPKHVVCVHCLLGQERELKQSFLGFFNFTCQECKKENTYPLSTGYVIIYGIAIVLFVLGLMSGRLQALVLGIGGAIAFSHDYKIREAAKKAQANERKPGQVAAEAAE